MGSTWVATEEPAASMQEATQASACQPQVSPEALAPDTQQAAQASTFSVSSGDVVLSEAPAAAFQQAATGSTLAGAGGELLGGPAATVQQETHRPTLAEGAE